MIVGNEDVTLTLEEVPGFALTVKAGSVTFPDGSKIGKMSVTVVNSSKVPMAPPNGMQPQFIVTIQPAGAKFDPPAPLQLPNVDGHKPGAEVEMYSYDHDLEEFVTIGWGTVSDDGKLIQSNIGVGVIKAGWHCGSQPVGGGCCVNCSACRGFDEDQCGCTQVDDKNFPKDICTTCKNGEVVPWEDGELTNPPNSVPNKFPDDPYPPYDNKYNTFEGSDWHSMTSDYGWRRKNNREDFHGAIDVDAEAGTPIMADSRTPNGSTVHCAGTCSGFPGQTVIINTGDGHYEVYAEMEETWVETGETLGPGDIIGVNDRKPGVHLHRGSFVSNEQPPVINDSTAVNPRPDIPQGTCLNNEYV